MQKGIVLQFAMSRTRELLTSASPVYLLGGLVLSAIAVFCSSFFVCNVLASINWDQKVHLGEAGLRNNLTSKCIIRNWTPRQLHVKRVSTSCGCTAASCSRLNVEPLGTLEIPVSINLRGKYGRVESQVAIEFYDHPTAHIYLDCFASNRNPTEVALGSFRRDVKKQAQFDISVNDVSSLIVRRLESSVPWLKLAYDIDANDSHLLHVRICTTDEVPYGEILGNIDIETNSKELPICSVKIIGNVLPMVLAKSKIVSMGCVSSGQPSSAIVELSSPYGKEIEFVEIVSDIPLICEVEPSASKSDMKVKVTLDSLLVHEGVFKLASKARCKIEGQAVDIPIEFFGYVARDSRTSAL